MIAVSKLPPPWISTSRGPSSSHRIDMRSIVQEMMIIGKNVTAAFSVTFFPMIIISWTIERMSILWEEDGPREVLIQGGGSLLTAIIAYLVMTERHVGFLVFTYPELLLVVLAVILAIGQYTGYRLSELRRFEPLSRDL